MISRGGLLNAGCAHFRARIPHCVQYYVFLLNSPVHIDRQREQRDRGTTRGIKDSHTYYVHQAVIHKRFYKIEQQRQR